MEYLADTVTVIRHFSRIGKIGKRAHEILNNVKQGVHHIHISVVSIVEIMYLSHKKRIDISLSETIQIINNSVNYSIVDLTPQIVVMAEHIKIPDLHDRLIIATAKHLGIPMLTSDKKIQRMHVVETIWD